MVAASGTRREAERDRKDFYSEYRVIVREPWRESHRTGVDPCRAKGFPTRFMKEIGAINDSC